MQRLAGERAAQDKGLSLSLGPWDERDLLRQQVYTTSLSAFDLHVTRGRVNISEVSTVDTSVTPNNDKRSFCEGPLLIREVYCIADFPVPLRLYFQLAAMARLLRQEERRCETVEDELRILQDSMASDELTRSPLQRTWLWYVPSSRYIWSLSPIFCFCKNK
jgi:hypothetical protein